MTPISDPLPSPLTEYRIFLVSDRVTPFHLWLFYYGSVFSFYSFFTSPFLSLFTLDPIGWDDLHRQYWSYRDTLSFWVGRYILDQDLKLWTSWTTSTVSPYVYVLVLVVSLLFHLRLPLLLYVWVEPGGSILMFCVIAVIRSILSLVDLVVSLPLK